MIRSMTAFGSARAESAVGSVTVEFRTVNSRFLDVSLRLPDDLRQVEGALRDRLGQAVKRGKVDIRVNFTRAASAASRALDPSYLASAAQQLQAARAVIPDVTAPSLAELVKGASNADAEAMDSEAWTALCMQACDQALAELQANREREGERLAQMMRECSASIADIVADVEAALPPLLAEHRQKLAAKLRDALEAAHPAGFSQISGTELSARIAQETSLFSMRIDVAEELSRLRSHVSELQHLLSGAGSPADGAGRRGKSATGSLGKRLDFLFQEMNREANTLGSKASDIRVTRAAIDLKLLIEQMREQAQNLE